MPRVGEFCTENVSKFILAAFIVIGSLVAIGIYCFHSGGKDDPAIKNVTTSSPH